MITPSFSLTATEQVLPKLALDFTTASLDPRVTFTRTTSATNPATYVDSNGYIVSATNNQPRFDYNPVTKLCNGLLIEESRSNLITNSNNFINWTNGNLLINENAAISPDNTQNASTYKSSGFYIQRDVTVVNSTTYSYSVYAKAGTNTSITVQGYAVGTSTYFFRSTFNLSNGTITSTQNGTASISDAGNGWYRCVVTGTSNTTTVTLYLIANSGVAIYGAQLEAGAFATSYIPTTGSAATRNADVATMTGTNFSDWWTATTGSANVSATQKSIGGTAPLIQFDDNTADNIISLRGNAANLELYIKATTDQAQIDAGTIVANTAYKLTGTWNTNNCAASQNGAAVVTDASATIPTVTQARIGSNGTNYANSWLQKINYWPQRITNNETQAFSK